MSDLNTFYPHVYFRMSMFTADWLCEHCHCIVCNLGSASCNSQISCMSEKTQEVCADRCGGCVFQAQYIRAYDTTKDKPVGL